MSVQFQIPCILCLGTSSVWGTLAINEFVTQLTCRRSTKETAHLTQSQNQGQWLWNGNILNHANHLPWTTVFFYFEAGFCEIDQASFDLALFLLGALPRSWDTTGLCHHAHQLEYIYICYKKYFRSTSDLKPSIRNVKKGGQDRWASNGVHWLVWGIEFNPQDLYGRRINSFKLSSDLHTSILTWVHILPPSLSMNMTKLH